MQFCEVCGYIKSYGNKFFFTSLLLLFLDPGSGMGKNQDPGSGINIPDPQHCLDGSKLVSVALSDKLCCRQVSVCHFLWIGQGHNRETVFSELGTHRLGKVLFTKKYFYLYFLLSALFTNQQFTFRLIFVTKKSLLFIE